MSGLYVPLDVEFASDDKIMRAGPLAELLYVRGLAFCKRTMSDGVITREQLTIVARGIGKPNWQASRLVEEGLWNATGTGWEVVGWHRRNKSKQAIETDRETRRNAAQKANHDRWHIGDQGKPSLSCPLCHPISDPTTDSDRISESDPYSDSHKPKPEPKPEGEPKGEEREKSSKPVDGSKNGHPNAAAAALRILLDHRLKTANTPGLKPMLEKTLPDEWREPIATFVASHPNTTAEEIATVVLKVPGLTYATSTPRAPWYADPNCIHCPGDGWVNDEHGYVSPCQCRQPDPYETLAPVHHLTRGAS